MALSYRQTLGHRFDIHEAIATAAPYSVSVLAYGAGSDFLYQQGYLCYRVGHEIRLLDVHEASQLERVLDLHVLLQRLDIRASVDSVQLLNYSHGIVVFRVRGCVNDILLAIDMVRSMNPQKPNVKRGRLLLQRIIPTSDQIFVRHSGSYLWYGIFTAGVWRLHGRDLATQQTIDFPLQIADGDIGQSLCFEIYEDHLYAVSTHVALTEEEKFSSFYHWFCYTPHVAHGWSGRIWRREHSEGPINEMWTDLSIRLDESTGHPKILECRREWPDGNSENHRTYYSESLPTPEENFTREAFTSLARVGVANHSKASSSDDLSANSQPYNERPAKRLRLNYHAEYESDDPTQRQEFIAARTKFSSYELAASTFIDLVNDPASDGPRSQDRLRLRTVSRNRKCPLDEETGLLFRPVQSDPAVPIDGAEERFTSRGVHIWPADDAPADLHRILCPDSRTGTIRAVSDERSLIYSVPCADLLPAFAPDHSALILINFDPRIRFPGLIAPGTAQPPVDERNSTGDTSRSGNGTFLRVAEPLYRTINWGYWLR